MSRRSLIAFAVACALAGGAGVAALPSQAATGTPRLRNGTQTGPTSSANPKPGMAAHLPDLDTLDPIKYSLKDTIVSHQQVLSRDGVNKIWVDIIRPKTAPEVKVPTIMDMSPYFNTLGRGWVGDCKTPSSSTIPTFFGCATYSDFPEFYDDYFVPRGYAVALMDLRGTRNTTGCQVYGDRVEVEDGVDVVDWIADQGWSNGKVGLTGGSYDGTMANGVAVEQPLIGKHKSAVSAVVPIRAIDRWYDYHFYNGIASTGHAATAASFTGLYATEDIQTQSPAQDPLVGVEIAQRKACVPTEGAMTDVGYAPVYQDTRSDFWQRRDYVKSAATTKAAFFLIHGLYDFNVKTTNVANMWAALPASAPKKLWLEDSDHVDPDIPTSKRATELGESMPFPFQKSYRTAVHRWWAQFLKGLPAGALLTPTVEVQQGDGSWLGSRSWPLPSKDLKVSLGTNGTLGTAAPQGSVDYSDGLSSAPSTQAFTTAPFTKQTRVSGQFAFDLGYQLTGVDTSITVQIDDLPPDSANDAPVTDEVLDKKTTGPFTITYGFARAAYAKDLKARGISSPTTPVLIAPGAANRITFGSLPLDYTIKPGHRLRFTFGSGLGGTLNAFTGGTVSLQLGTSTIKIPVVR